MAAKRLSNRAFIAKACKFLDDRGAMRAEIERLRDRAERAEAAAENEAINNRDMRAAIMWALGEAPDVHGQWFGEKEPEVPEGGRPRPYWWRTHLRGMAGIDQQEVDTAK